MQMYTNLFRDKRVTELEVWWTFIDWEKSGKWEIYQYIFLLFLKWQMLIKITEALNSIIGKLYAFSYLVSYLFMSPLKFSELTIKSLIKWIINN